MNRSAPGLLSRSHRRVSLAVYTMTALSAFESLAAIAALPEIGADLGQVDLVPWVVTVYLIASTMASVSAGPFIDGVGVRTVFRVGTAVFLTGSLLAAAAPSMPFLIAARVVHGVGGGLIFASGLSAVPLVFPPSLVGRAYAANATVWGVMSLAGPGIAAAILTVLNWRWIFLSIVPLVVIALALSWTKLPGPLGTERAGFDVRGFGLVALFFVSLVLALGTLSATSFAWLGLSALAAWAYVAHEGRTESPLVKLRHLVGRPYGWANAGIALLLTGGIGAYAYTPLFVRAARAASEALTAWSVLFVTVGWTVGANVAGRLQGRQPPGLIAGVGSAVCAASLATTGLLAFAGAPLWMIFGTLSLVGFGLGTGSNASLQLIRFATEDGTIGRATTAHDFGRNTGFTMGAAVAGAVLLLVIGSQVPDLAIVRELLGGADLAAIDGAAEIDAAGAVADGFAWAMFTGAVIVIGSIPFYWRLSRWSSA